MTLTDAEKQASWRERNLKSENGTKVCASVHFRRQHQGAAQADRLSQGSLGNVSHQWVASAERRITHQLSGKALKHYYDGE